MIKPNQTTSVMDKLDKAYEAVDLLENLGLPVSNEQLNAISQMEKDYLSEEIIPLIKQELEPMVQKLRNQFNMTVVYTKENGLEILLSEPNMYSSNQPHRIDDRKNRKKKFIIRVKFPDNRVSCQKIVANTFFDVIKYAGAENVERLGIMALGQNIITNELHEKEQYRPYQREIEPGLYLNTFIDTDKKYEVLRIINRELDLNLTIEKVLVDYDNTMSELDKAYETADMLKALDLPISKDQLENIERLEKESGVGHREDLTLYYFEQCYASYTKRIMNIRQAKIRGEVIVAKPVLLLAIIDGISSDMFSINEFCLTEWLEARYVMLMQRYMKSSQFDKPTDISNPFWHLQSDGFWHLQYDEEPQESTTPSKRWLKDKVSYAYFDDELWILLQNKVWRLKLRDYIVEHKLSGDHWFGKIAAEGLGAIAALILAA